MGKLKKVVNTVLNIAIFFFALLLFLDIFLDFQTTILKKSYKSFFGISAFEIQTASMEGTINIGDLVIVKNTKNVKLNDVVTYDVGGRFVTHRVVQQISDTFVTKGDANNTDDTPISSDQIVGKVICVLPKFGFLKSVFFKPGVLIPFIVILFVICLIIDDKEDNKNSYFKLFIDRFKKKKKEVPIEVNNTVVNEQDMSKTAVLSRIDVKSNNSLLSSIKEDKKDLDNNSDDDDDFNRPRIIGNF